MTDRDSAQNELSDRMSTRFGNDDSDSSDTSTTDDTDDTDDNENYRDVWATRLFYLPTDLADRIANEKKRLDYKADWDIGMERHYYPVVATVGIESIEAMSVEEFEAQLDELGIAY